MAKFSCCRVIQGRSLRSAWTGVSGPRISLACAKVWSSSGYQSGGTPESVRSLRSGQRRRQVSVGTAESPVHQTGVSGLSMKTRRWRGSGHSSRGRPELGRSLRPTPESPTTYTGDSGPSSVQQLHFGEGYKYPSPTLERVARPAFQEPYFLRS